MHKFSRVLGWSICLGVVSSVLSCVQSVSDKSDPEPTPKLGALISALPDIAAALPKSLQDGVQSTTSASLRAMGDVTTLDPASVPGVRSQGYVEVKTALSSSFVGQLMPVLKAAIADKDVALDTDVRLGTVTLPDDVVAPDGSTTMDIGIIRATKVGAVTQVKWTINVTMDAVTAPMHIYLELEGDSETNLKAKYAVSYEPQEGYSIQVVGSFDAATGKTTEIYLPTANTPGQYTVMTNQGGVVKYYTVQRGVPDTSMTDSLSLAYATDTMGGVVYKYEDEETNQYVYSEYYNGSGDLVASVYGDSTDTSGAGYFSEDIASGFNVHSAAATKPESVMVKHTYTFTGNSEPTTAYKLSVDAGTTWTTLNAGDYEGKTIYWRAGTEPAAGDSLYFYASSTSEDGSWDGDTQTYTFVTTLTYRVGFTIPTPQSYLGANFYATTTFPLKYLRPASGLPLRQKEGESVTVDFQDEDGVSYSYTYNTNEYWLENTKWKNKDGNDDNSDDTVDADKGDIVQDRLEAQDFYYWDSTGDDYTKTKAYVMVTTEPSPVGWNFETGAKAVVDGVKDNVTALYSQVPTNLSADFKAEADTIVKMPDSTTFPSY